VRRIQWWNYHFNQIFPMGSVGEKLGIFYLEQQSPIFNSTWFWEGETGHGHKSKGQNGKKGFGIVACVQGGYHTLHTCGPL
jgi:hypothetical protein